MISVCMATYNGKQFIKQQIDSILPQLGVNDELIISDDGSKDGTLELIESYEDRRIKVLHHLSSKEFTPHEKATANFENALSVAKGEYIFLSDQDDEWCDNKITVCMNYLKDYDFIVHTKKRINDEDEIIRTQNDDFITMPKNWISHLCKMKWYGCCMAFNRKVLDIVLPFPDKLIGHDYWISALAIKLCKINVIDEPLILYRCHEGAVSQGKKNTLLFKISYRLKLIMQTYKRILRIERNVK